MAFRLMYFNVQVPAGGPFGKVPGGMVFLEDLVSGGSRSQIDLTFVIQCQSGKLRSAWLSHLSPNYYYVYVLVICMVHVHR